MDDAGAIRLLCVSTLSARNAVQIDAIEPMRKRRALAERLCAANVYVEMARSGLTAHQRYRSTLKIELTVY